MSSIIDLENLAFEDILKNLTDWVKAKPANARWQDFYASSAGQTVLELVAGLATYDAYRIGMVEREVTLDFAVTRAAYLMRASLLGYPVNRNSAPVLRLTVDSGQSYPLWDKLEPIGTTTDGKLKIALVNSQPIEEGVQIIDVYVGCWKEYTEMSTENADFTRIYFEDERADNDLDRFFLRIADEAVPLVHFAEDLNSDNALVKTTIEGFFLQFGDGVFGRRLLLEEIDLVYLSTYGRLSAKGMRPADLRLNVGIVTDVEVLLVGSNADSNEKIRTLAPAYFATQRVMVSKKDHETMILSYDGDIISACSSRDPNICCGVNVCCLYEDERVLSPVEKELLIDFLNEFKVAGEVLAVVDPVRIGLNIEITVVINENESDPDIYLLIRDIVEEQMFKLGGDFYIGHITRKVSELDGVLRVYLTHPSSDRTLSCQEYIALDVLDLKLTTNAGVIILHDPHNEGYIL